MLENTQDSSVSYFTLWSAVGMKKERMRIKEGGREASACVGACEYMRVNVVGLGRNALHEQGIDFYF